MIDVLNKKTFGKIVLVILFMLRCSAVFSLVLALT